jgi:hypothetical protein
VLWDSDCLAARGIIASYIQIMEDKTPSLVFELFQNFGDIFRRERSTNETTIEAGHVL